VQAAVNSVNADMAVAVVDRAGFVLGVFRTQNAPARRLKFRTVAERQRSGGGAGADRRIFQQRSSPALVANRAVHQRDPFSSGSDEPPTADLYGIENTNRGCTLINDPAFQSKIPPSLALGGGFGLGVLTARPMRWIPIRQR